MGRKGIIFVYLIISEYEVYWHLGVYSWFVKETIR